MIQVITVATAEQHHLLLEFNTGEWRRFDMRPYLGYPVFRRLAHRGFFELAHVDYGTVVWPGDIDIAPETLYEGSVPVDPAVSESRDSISNDLGAKQPLNQNS